MVRRSFRIGLRLGLLFGVVFALVKTVQARRSAAAVPPPAPWEPIIDTPRPTPPAPAARTEAPVVDEVGEPVMEPAPPLVDEPALDVPVAPVDPALDVVPAPHEVDAPAATPTRKVAGKKLAAAKKAPAAKKAAAKKAAKKSAPAAALAAFVEPQGGVCPPTHPVKAKLASRLFHLPGMFAYDRTRPDRCYLDADAAVADGFTSAKR